jgi:hypothetical protein
MARHTRRASRKAHATRKHAAGHIKAVGTKAIKNLRKLGYIAKKGKFTLFTKKSKRGGFSDSAAGEMKPVV